jgi:uncharacterized iron-regulated protein
MNPNKIKFFLSLLAGLYSIFGCSQTNDKQLTEYVNFLHTQNTSAKNYILGLFEKYDIVVLCERNHKEMTQYDLIFDIASDNLFTENAGEIIMEVGVANSSGRLNEFLHNTTLPESQIEDNLLNIIRNNDYNPLWEMTNYPVFIKKLHYLNKTLPAQKQITVHPIDFPFSWNTVNSRKEYKTVMDTVDFLRDEIMGAQMENIINKNPNKKFLIIMNAYHTWFIPEKYGAAWWVKNSFPQKTVNVLINNVWMENLTDDGLWDAAFKITEKENLGFDLGNTVFGNTLFCKYLGDKYLIFEYVFSPYLTFSNLS